MLERKPGVPSFSSSIF